MATYDAVPIRTLESERLVLRPTAIDDAEAIQRIFNDFEIVKYLVASVPWPYPADGAITYLTTLLLEGEKRESYPWTIFLKPDLEPIGHIVLTPTSGEDHRGFWLAPCHWGKGFMREASNLATEFAFSDLHMEFLLLNNAEPNRASHRMKEAAGAEVIAVRPEVAFIGGTFASIRWKLTREAWNASPAKRAWELRLNENRALPKGF